jgi:pyrimidine deaminase RibD-like protein
MLIREKLPQGYRYPQITEAPANYDDFLNFFRDGHTIDDNLGATTIAATPQARMLETAIASRHLTKTKNMLMDNGLADIYLTKSGAELIQSYCDRPFCEIAIAESRKSIAEDNRPHPFVGAVVVKDGKILATGYRGESGKGDHGEYCAMKKLNANVDNVDLSGCTIYTTLEPCSERNSPHKTPCTIRLIKGNVTRVVYGMADKDASVYGHPSLVEAGIKIDVFPDDLVPELLALNKKWSDSIRVKLIVPPNNTNAIADVSYNKPGTPMTDNIYLFVRPPKDVGGFYTIEDAAKNVLAYGRTLEEIAVEWRQIDTQKVLVEKLDRQGYGNGSGSRLLNLF